MTNTEGQGDLLLSYSLFSHSSKGSRSLNQVNPFMICGQCSNGIDSVRIVHIFWIISTSGLDVWYFQKRYPDATKGTDEHWFSLRL